MQPEMGLGLMVQVSLGKRRGEYGGDSSWTEWGYWQVERNSNILHVFTELGCAHHRYLFFIESKKSDTMTMTTSDNLEFYKTTNNFSPCMYVTTTVINESVTTFVSTPVPRCSLAG